MKTRFSFIDPGVIMGVVVCLIILAVGVFAFYVTLNALSPKVAIGYDHASNMTNWTYWGMQNASASANQVFNILGVVLIIGAIMAIVGLVYNYVR